MGTLAPEKADKDTVDSLLEKILDVRCIPILSL